MYYRFIGLELYWSERAIGERDGWREGLLESIGTIVINKKLVEFRPDYVNFPQPGIFLTFSVLPLVRCKRCRKLLRQFPKVVKKTLIMNASSCCVAVWYFLRFVQTSDRGVVCVVGGGGAPCYMVSPFCLLYFNT